MIDKEKKRPVAIIAAMEPEWVSLKLLLADKQEFEKFGQSYLSGILCGQSVIIALSGIGKVNAAMSTTCLIDTFDPVAVINTGSAGGLTENTHIGDVVIGTIVAHHDVDVTGFGYQMGQVPQLPLVFMANQHLTSVAEKAAFDFQDGKVQQGLIVSGDQFVDAKDKIEKIRASFPNALACEMEAASIAQVCHQAQLPFVIIRAISDHANEKAEVSFDAFIEKAGESSAEMVKKILENLPEKL